jgi:hypothetical protein
MPPSSPFSEYAKGSETNTTSGNVPAITAGTGQQGAVQQQPVMPMIEVSRYGTGKPRRIIMRGKLSRG